MNLIKKYKIFWSPKFTKEFQDIISYINFQYREYSICNYFKNSIINLISSLNFFPERYPKIANFKYKNRNIRKIVFKNYIIIYEVQIDIR